jgi:hypothetical protein
MVKGANSQLDRFSICVKEETERIKQEALPKPFTIKWFSKEKGGLR